MKREVYHYKVFEYKNESERKFKGNTGYFSCNLIPVDYEDESGRIIFQYKGSCCIVDDKTYERGGLDCGYVNGKFQEIEIYY